MNECILAVCIALSAGFTGDSSVEATYSNAYIKAAWQQDLATLTQGVKLSKGNISAWYGFGTYVQSLEYSPNGYMVESGVRYTLGNLYGQMQTVDQDIKFSVGLTRSF